MNRGEEGRSLPADTGPDLDFERADFGDAAVQGGSLACSICAGPISSEYFTRDSAFVCGRCEGPAREAGPAGSRFGRLMGALGLGTLAAIVASALWMFVTELTGYEIGLIAIAVGWIVGIAIQVGNRGVGGRPYQLMAIFLTYSAIVMTYVPMLVTELTTEWTAASSETSALELEYDPFLEPATAHEDAALAEPGEELQMSPEDAQMAAWIVAIPFAYALPFLAGFENVIGILIIGFAVFQAWKITTRVETVWAGPFQVGSESAG